MSLGIQVSAVVVGILVAVAGVIFLAQEEELAPPLFEVGDIVGDAISFDRRFSSVIDVDTRGLVIANGFGWAEGPVWIPKSASEPGYLLYSDVLVNKIFKTQKVSTAHEDGSTSEAWTTTTFMTDSGCSSAEWEERRLKEPGSNGLAVGPGGELYLCQHGARQIVRLTSRAEGNAKYNFEAVASHFGGKRFSSPNDLVFDKDDKFMFFTDPTYGLRDDNITEDYSFSTKFSRDEYDLDKHKDRVQPKNGVYRMRNKPGGEPELVHKTMNRPNGIAFSPDFSLLYICNSDAHNLYIKVFKVDDGSLDVGRVFFNLTRRPDLTAGGHPGLFDGLSVDSSGNLWSSMPGGMLVINPNGDALGKFETKTKTANVAFGDDGKVYIAAHQHIIEVQTKVSGALPLRHLKEGL